MSLVQTVKSNESPRVIRLINNMRRRYGTVSENKVPDHQQTRQHVRYLMNASNGPCGRLSRSDLSSIYKMVPSALGPAVLYLVCAVEPSTEMIKGGVKMSDLRDDSAPSLSSGEYTEKGVRLNRHTDRVLADMELWFPKVKGTFVPDTGHINDAHIEYFIQQSKFHTDFDTILTELGEMRSCLTGVTNIMKIAIHYGSASSLAEVRKTIDSGQCSRANHALESARDSRENNLAARQFVNSFFL